MKIVRRLRERVVSTRQAVFPLDRRGRSQASELGVSLVAGVRRLNAEVQTWLILVALFAGALASVGCGSSSQPTQVKVANSVCDILQTAGTPCVGAHSTTRTLFAAYAGPLYQVQRADGQTLDIRPVATGSVANSASQDAFCSGSSCTIWIIYDQSPQHNDLTIEARGTGGLADRGAQAAALPVTLNGQPVYGISFDGRMGYRNNLALGLAKNGEPETMMMVTSARHTNSLCCFDYGNSEIVNTDTGNGHEDALYMGTRCKPGATCLGSGPWIAADLENGLYQSADAGNSGTTYRGSITPFVTALLKNDGQTTFTLRCADAQQGPLTDIYSSALPSNHIPMHQEGGIVLGTGGDNTNGGTGYFFEGWIVKGLTTAQAESAIQANIVAAGYGGLQ